MRMGDTSGRNFKRCAPDCKCGRHVANSGSFGPGDWRVAKGRATRFKQRLPRPGIGDRFGQLEVVDFDLGPDGGLEYVKCRCSCGNESPVAISNLRKGASTRCNSCAKKAARQTRDKLYYGYKDVIADDEHRRRLLNRISSCHSRCFNPNNKGFPNYGGRGISVFWGRDRRAFLAHLVTLRGWDDPSLDLDRIDVDGDYAPGNLRFITRSENCFNKRKMQDKEAEIAALRERIRHLERGAAQPLHDIFG